MIRFEDVHLAFPGKAIFSGLNLTVPENEKLLIAGPSGSGKTTLFRALLGFERINAGRVYCGELEVTARNIRAVRDRIFYLSQDIDFRNAPVTEVLDEIFNYEPNQGLIHSPEQRHSLMEMLDLGEEILQQNLAALSGGERQRLGLLVGFLLNRPIWLLDEPTSSLDERLRKRVMNYVMAMGKTVIIISHDDIWQQNESLRVERWA